MMGWVICLLILIAAILVGGFLLISYELSGHFHALNRLLADRLNNVGNAVAAQTDEIRRVREAEQRERRKFEDF